jgi:mannose-6-phosphate isomerase-like protein (cupin superfamily)
MTGFATKSLPEGFDLMAPDGSEVRVLLALSRGSMAHFRLGARHVSRAVSHRSVEEIWYIVVGTGEMWRSSGTDPARSEIVRLSPGVCVTIPAGTAFQFRAGPDNSLCAVAVTMPPWPGDDEAIFVDGPWIASQSAG